MREAVTRARKDIGSETVNQNGYTQVKTADRGWIGKHILIAEKKLGRLVDPRKEMVRFEDGDRSNFNPDNIKVIPRGKNSLRKRLATLEARKDDIIAEIEDVKEQLAGEASDQAAS